MKAIRENEMIDPPDMTELRPISRQQLPTWVHGALVGVVTVLAFPVVFWAVLITLLAPEPYPGATKMAKFWRAFGIVFAIKLVLLVVFYGIDYLAYLGR